MNRREFLIGTGTAAAGYLGADLLARGAEDPAAAGAPMVRVAVIGFGHSHVWGLIDALRRRPDVEIVAACEEDPAIRADLAKDGRIKITHADYRQLLAEPNIDAIAVGEWFGRRGRIVIDSLKSGRPAISDKPLCTTLEDYEEIARLSHDRHLAVGMMLELRDTGVFIKMRDLAQAGEIGDIREIDVGAQHPLSLESRPHWYHEAGKHGGTINDIGIHAFDALPWLTGLGFRRVAGARAWQTKGLPEGSHFKNGGQVLLEMDNGAGMIGSFSYVQPSHLGYTVPMYWRITLWGGSGVLEASHPVPHVSLYKDNEKTPRVIPPAPKGDDTWLDSFVREVRGQPGPSLSTADVLQATRTSLLVQAAADEGKCNVML
jgi:predicted dehydrogenase